MYTRQTLFEVAQRSPEKCHCCVWNGKTSRLSDSFLCGHFGRQEADVQSEKARIKTIITTFTEQIKGIEKDIKALICKAKELKADVALLMTIPGVGHLTVATVICVAGDLRRFNTRKECASCAGCSPRIVPSGLSMRKKPRLSKAGNRFLRQTLYMASLTALRAKNSVFKQTYERLKRGGSLNLSLHQVNAPCRHFFLPKSLSQYRRFL